MDIFGKLFGFLLIVAVFGAVLAFPTMWLWNGVFTEVFDGVNEIDAWQALGLVVLGRILVGNS